MFLRLLLVALLGLSHAVKAPDQPKAVIMDRQTALVSGATVAAVATAAWHQAGKPALFAKTEQQPKGLFGAKTEAKLGIFGKKKEVQKSNNGKLKWTLALAVLFCVAVYIFQNK